MVSFDTSSIINLNPMKVKIWKNGLLLADVVLSV